MTGKPMAKTLLWGCATVFFLIGNAARADEQPVTREQLRALQEQNEKLQQQLQKQQEMIDTLTKKVSEIQDATAKRDQDLSSLKAEVKEEENQPAPSTSAVSFGRVKISGEGGIAFFDSQRDGQYPAGQFRVDEARLFIEAPVWGNVYFYTEADLATREDPTLGLNVGELHLDWQNVSDLWGSEHILNLRAGRFYIPFGEEYQNRFAIDNPLISHSLSDLWGAEASGRFLFDPFEHELRGAGVAQSLLCDNQQEGSLNDHQCAGRNLQAEGLARTIAERPENHHGAGKRRSHCGLHPGR